MPLPVASRAARIELLLLDVDGVLTDGGITYTDDGTEIKRFHVRDGVGLKAWQLAGHRVAILSGRQSPAVERRAAELGITIVLQGRADGSLVMVGPVEAITASRAAVSAQAEAESAGLVVLVSGRRVLR